MRPCSYVPVGCVEALLDLGHPAAAPAPAADLATQAFDVGHVTYLVLAQTARADALVRLPCARRRHRAYLLVATMALAETLGVSVNTVRTRLRRLYQKLRACDRESVSAAARAAGVLSARS